MFKYRKLLTLPTLPCSTAPLRGNPLEFLGETHPAKTRWMGLPYGENFIILTSTVLYDPPVWCANSVFFHFKSNRIVIVSLKSHQ